MRGPVYRFGGFTLRASARELLRADAHVPLSPRAFDCLTYLIEHRDRAVGKDELVEAIWGRPNVSDTQLGQTVLRARRAVGDDGQIQRVIRTVARYGYHFIADVDVIASDERGVPAATVVEADDDAPTEQSYGPSDAQAPARTMHRRRVGPIAAVALAVAVAAILFALALYRPIATLRIAAARENIAVVLPLRIEADADQAWLRLGAMDLVAQRLREGGLSVRPSEEVVALLQASPDADRRQLRSRSADAWLIDGALARREHAWVATLQAEAADGTQLKIDASAPLPLDAAREAGDRLLARLGRATPTRPIVAAAVEERLQRAQAALLANELDEARAILVSDPDLARSEPQLAYRLAQVDFRAGEYRRAESSLTALLSEPAASEPLFRARLLNARAGVRLRLDDIAAAERDYDAAIALLQGGDHAPEIGLALTGRGVARGIHHAFADALADFGEARVQLEAAGDVLAVARVDSNLGGLEMNRDRPEQALPYLDAAAARFEEYGAINELMETLESLVSDNLALLRPDDALIASDRSWTLAARVTDPNQRLDIVLDRVDVLIALGRLHEAGGLLAGLAATAADANPFLARRLPALRARLALAEDRAADAAAQARIALALPAPSDDSGEGVAEIALIAQRAGSATSAQTAPRIDDGEPTEPPRYPVQGVLLAERAAAGADPDAAERAYRLALDMAEKRGVPADVALVSESYGRWLLQRGDLERATAIIGRVAPWATRDYPCTLLQVRLFHALGKTRAWAQALAQARRLAGDRAIPADLTTAPAEHGADAIIGSTPR